MKNRHIAITTGILFIFGVFLMGIPGISHAGSDTLHVSGWIPYWKSSEGTRDAKKHLDTLSEVNPFAFTVTSKGKLKDLAGLSKSTWKKFITTARKDDVLIIPTIMWSDTETMHEILSDEKARTKHIKEIVTMVKKGKYDGVDIDYEGRWLSTKDAFSRFIEELDDALPRKTLLSCTVEAQTPPDSLYRTVPTTDVHPTDLSVMEEHCDSVKVMTYDQRRADLQLNDARKGQPYVPVADADWVRKVIVYMTQTISPEKLSLGVATYGHEYEVVVSPDWFQAYNRLWALNPSYGVEFADERDITPTRNAAGELSFSYPSIWDFSESLIIPNNTPEGDIIAARALAYANTTGQTVTFNYMTWSDAAAIKEKVELAEEYGLAGIAIFKIDGGEDQDIWDLFE